MLCDGPTPNTTVRMRKKFSGRRLHVLPLPDIAQKDNRVRGGSVCSATEEDKVDWPSQVALSHLTDEDLMKDVYEMMSRHEEM